MESTTVIYLLLTLAAIWGIWRFFPVWRYNGETIRLHQWSSWRLVYKNEKLRRAIDATMHLKSAERLKALTALVENNPGGLEGWRLATEIVATGVPEALPWVDQMLENWQHGSHVLNGVHWAVKRNQATEEFRIKVFQKLVPWLTVEGYSRDRLPETLLELDEEWALRVLTDSDVVTPKLDIFKSVTEALRKHGHAFTIEQIRRWLPDLENSGQDALKERGYLEILKVYIQLDEADAELRLKELVYRKECTVSYAAAEFLLEYHNQPMPRGRILTQVERHGPESLSPVHRIAWLVDMGYIYPVIHCDGLAYYFQRDEADRWPEVVEALRVVGAYHHAELLSVAAKLFGPAGPSLNMDERVKQFEMMGEGFPDRLRELEEKSSRIGEELEVLLLIYLLENQV